MKIIPQAPLNIVLVQLNKKLYDTVTFSSGITLFKDTSFHPEEVSMSEATVASLPRGIQDRFDYFGMSTEALRVGDRVLIRYDVIFHYVNQPDRDSPIYKNVLLYDGQEYWRVDIQQIFGILRKGYVEMLNGYAMVDPCIEHNNYGVFETAAHFATRRSNEQYKIRYIGENKEGLKIGDIIHIHPGLAQNYETDWGNFSIVRQYNILATGSNIS